MNGPGWLLMGAHGGLWAVRNDRVRRVERTPAGVRVHLEHHVLAAERVLTAAAALDVASPGELTRAVLPAGCVGLAPHPMGPVLAVDADAPPAALLAVAAAPRGGEEEEEHGVVRQ